MDLRWTAFVMFGLSSQLFAQSAPITQEQQEVFKKYYRMRAAQIRFAPGANPPIKLAKDAAQSWSMQDRDNFLSGEVFVWEREGRPEVIGCIGSLSMGGRKRGVFQEFHHLGRQRLPESPLTVYPGGRMTTYDWNPPALPMEPVRTQMKPAGKAPARLLQLRGIAKTFSIEMQAPGGTEQLRRLSQPIYRYDLDELAKAKSEVIDGAIFAYVWTKGTDPECLLMVECRGNEKEASWFYAPVRFGYRPLRMQHHEKVVWNDDGQGNGIERNTMYFTNGGGESTIEGVMAEVAKSKSVGKKES